MNKNKINKFLTYTLNLTKMIIIYKNTKKFYSEIYKNKYITCEVGLKMKYIFHFKNIIKKRIK